MAAPKGIFRDEGFDATSVLRTEDVMSKSLTALKSEGRTYRFETEKAAHVLKSEAPVDLLKQKSKAAAGMIAQGGGDGGGDAAEEATGDAMAKAKQAVLASPSLLKRAFARFSDGQQDGMQTVNAVRTSSKPDVPVPASTRSGRENDGSRTKSQKRRGRRPRSDKAKVRRAARRKAARKAVEAGAARKAAKAARAPKAAAGAVKSSMAWAVAGVACLVALLLSLAVAVPVFFSSSDDGELNYEGLTDAERTVAMYLHGKGLDALHIAAIMGNIRAESNFDPSVIEGGTGIGLGLIQWSFGNRTALENYAASLGRPAGDIGVQLDFLWWQMTGEGDGLAGDPGAYSGVQWQWTGHSQGCLRWLADHGMTKNPPASMEGFKSMGTLEGATGYFTWAFERPSDAGAKVDLRTEFATAYYQILTAKRGGSGNGEGVVALAMGELGKPYVWGACGPDSFDCSGLVSYALTGVYGKRLGTTQTFINWPRTDSPVPGDICVNSHHCGIYIGDGKMIHAPQSGDVVKIGPVQRDMVYVRYPG